MLRLYYMLEGYQKGSRTEEELRAKLADYDAMLYEWNDVLNLNLALVGTYFGQAARDYLESSIYEVYRSVGSQLEQQCRVALAGGRVEVTTLSRRFGALNDLAYRFGVFMMTHLREEKVGRAAPDPLRPVPLK